MTKEQIAFMAALAAGAVVAGRALVRKRRRFDLAGKTVLVIRSPLTALTRKAAAVNSE